jgi:hypothetical protein
MGEPVGLGTAPCRMVTADEVAHLHEHGWVQLKHFVDPNVLALMLERARDRMGDDADSNPLPPQVEAAVADGAAGLD